MPFDPVAHGRVLDIDYGAERPFRSWKRPVLLEKIEKWLSLNPPRLELATLAWEELIARGGNRANAAGELFVRATLPPIPWLADARKVVLKELPPSSTPGRNGRLYVILRGGYTRMNGWYGAYVGVTCKTVERRFLQHRTDIHAAQGLKNHGIELLYSLFHWANPIPGGRDERRHFETKLHQMLERVIPKVTGDTYDNAAKEPLSFNPDA